MRFCLTTYVSGSHLLRDGSSCLHILSDENCCAPFFYFYYAASFVILKRREEREREREREIDGPREIDSFSPSRNLVRI